MNNALALAARQIGMNERDQKAALTEFLRNGGQNLDPTTTAWCAAFVNSAIKQAGGTGTNSLAARDFLKWGEAVQDPQMGDIAVFSRGDPDGWQGHVGFFKGMNPDGTIRVLGGNQGDAVSIANYSPDQLLGYRRAPGGQTQNALAGFQQQEQPEPQNALVMPQIPDNRREWGFQMQPTEMPQMPQFGTVPYNTRRLA